MLRGAAFLLVVLAAGHAAAELARDEPPPPPGADAFLGCKKYPADKKFKWSVRGEVGVGELAASLGEIACKPIVVPKAVADRAGKVVLEVPDLVTAADVYRLFYAALEGMGLTVDASGGAIKIVDSGRAKEVAAPALDGSVPAPGDDRFVVRLLHPKHATPAELADVLAKMKSKDGDVSAFGASSLIVVDRATNARRMEELARALDVGEAGARIFTLTTHAQSPTDLAGAIEKILSSAAHRSASASPSSSPGKGPQPTGAVVDDEVRALVPLDAAHLIAVIGSDAGWQRVQAVAERIDPPAADGSGSSGHVIYLANTNAEDMATTLSSVGLSSRVTGGTSARAGAPGAPPSSMASGSQSPLALTGDVRIGADKTANALVVFANASDFATVKELVGKLDIPRRQVYVEAVILDLSIDKARTLGISWHNTDKDSGTFQSVQSPSLVSFDATSIAAAAAGGGLVTGIMGPTGTLLGKSIPSFGVILQALERNKDANVISRPHLLTMDNVKATLSVGQVIHYAASSMSNGTATSAGAIFGTTYQAQDVALKLELTPHLNDSPSIRLEINGEISDIPDGQAASPGGPTIDKRTLQTAVVVRDGETVVLGGLVKETDSVTVDKIPFLGDIPLLGRLFQTKSKQRVKQDLLIVLTPYIIRGPDDIRRIAERRECERREFLERYSAFADNNFEARVDYKRKRGLLEEINQTAIAAERDAEAVDAAERALAAKKRTVDGPIALEPVQ